MKGKYNIKSNARPPFFYFILNLLHYNLQLRHNFKIIEDIVTILKKILCFVHNMIARHNEVIFFGSAQ